MTPWVLVLSIYYGSVAITAISVPMADEAACFAAKQRAEAELDAGITSSVYATCLPTEKEQTP